MRVTYTAVAIACSLAANFDTMSAAVAADTPQTMFVIDGSGSMWGRFDADKRAKIDVVRDLVRAKIEAAPPQPIGVASFGHRRKADCGDVEIIVPPTEDRAAVLPQIEKLNPRGKGPLVAALREAVATLGAARPASVIVINDGADNCQQDACAAAQEIAAKSPGVPIHMIAVGVEASDIPRLACVAKATGGTFHEAKDTAGLSTALDAATALAMQFPGSAPSTAAPSASATPQPIVAGATLQASVSLAPDGPAIAIPVHWRILKSGSDAVLTESDGPNFSARVDPGSYEIEAEAARIRVKQTIAIEAGRARSIVLPLNAARLTVNTKGEKAASSPMISIEPVLDEKSETDSALIGRLDQQAQIVAAGKYTVSVADGAVRQSKPVTLAAGLDTTLDFALGTGRIELSAGLREDGGAIEDVTFSISEDDPDSPDGRREVARSRAPAPSFTLRAGTYYVTAWSGDGEVHERIAVGAGDVVKRALILPLVPVKVTALIGGQPTSASQGIVYRVTALDGDRREITRSVMPEMTLSLLPGRYRIAAHLDAHHLKAAEEVAVEPGKSMSVELKFDAGEVSLKPAGAALSGSRDVYWEIVDASGKPVWRSMMAEARALLAPGRYTVRLDARDKSTEAAFEVRAGEHKVVQVGQN